MKSGRGRILFFILGAFGTCLLANIFFGFIVLKRLERKAGAPIEGRFLPHLALPSFSLRDSRFEWQKRFRIESGNFTVRYDPFFMIPGRKLHTWIEGTNLQARLFGELVESQGVSEVEIDRVVADLAFFEKGPPEIFLFDVESRQIQFRLARAKEV